MQIHLDTSQGGKPGCQGHDQFNRLIQINGCDGLIDTVSEPVRIFYDFIRPGDLLVTSGLGGAFPAGYPVAIVETVTRVPQEPFADVTARPAAALDQVREVMLIWSAEARPPAETDDE